MHTLLRHETFPTYASRMVTLDTASCLLPAGPSRTHLRRTRDFSSDSYVPGTNPDQGDPINRATVKQTRETEKFSVYWETGLVVDRNPSNTDPAR